MDAANASLATLAPDRRREYTMAFALLFFVLSTFGSPFIHGAVGQPGPLFADPVTWLALGLGLICLVTFFVARRGHVGIAAPILTWTFFALVWAGIAVTVGDGSASPVYLVVPPILAAFVLGFREVLVAGAANTIGAMGLVVSGLVSMDIGFTAGLLTTATTGVLAIITWRQSIDHAIIRQQGEALLARTEQVEAIFAASQDALLSIDTQGRIITYNNAAQRLSHGSLRAGDRIFEALVSPLGGQAMAAIGSDDDLPPVQDKNGHAWDVRAHPLREQDGFLIILRDVTQRIEREREDRERYQQSVQIEKLEELNQFKTDFLNMASHELNTPLTPVRLQMELLKSPEQGPLNKNQARSLEIVDRNIRRLVKLVQDLVDVAKMSSARLRLDRAPVALDTLLRDEMASYQIQADESQIQMIDAITGPVWVEGDANRLGQVVANLFANALKFTPLGGKIEVGCRIDGDNAHAWVRDTGLGVPADRRHRLFQPFVQLHDESRIQGGTGLGLYICRGIIESHGGAIGHHPENIGSTFWFTLPVMASSELPIHERHAN